MAVRPRKPGVRGPKQDPGVEKIPAAFQDWMPGLEPRIRPHEGRMRLSEARMPSFLETRRPGSRGWRRGSEGWRLGNAGWPAGMLGWRRGNEPGASGRPDNHPGKLDGRPGSQNPGRECKMAPREDTNAFGWPMRASGCRRRPPGRGNGGIQGQEAGVWDFGLFRSPRLTPAPDLYILTGSSLCSNLPSLEGSTDIPLPDSIVLHSNCRNSFGSSPLKRGCRKNTGLCEQ